MSEGELRGVDLEPLWTSVDSRGVVKGVSGPYFFMDGSRYNEEGLNALGVYRGMVVVRGQGV